MHTNLSSNVSYFIRYKTKSVKFPTISLHSASIFIHRIIFLFEFAVVHQIGTFLILFIWKSWEHNWCTTHRTGRTSTPAMRFNLFDWDFVRIATVVYDVFARLLPLFLIFDGVFGCICLTFIFTLVRWSLALNDFSTVISYLLRHLI